MAGLSGLAALVRAADALPRGTARVRAAAALVDAYARVDAAHARHGARLGACPDWTRLGVDCLSRAVDALAPRALAAPFDSGQELVREARTASVSGGLADRRRHLLADGAALRGRLAVLHRVATEVATRPEAAADLAARAPEPWRAEAARIVASGVVLERRGARFIGSAEDPRFPASLARAIVLADAGQVEMLRRCVAELPAKERASARPLDALALAAAGDIAGSRHALRKLGQGDRDRALGRICSREALRGRTDLAEGFASAIASPALRHRALASTLEVELALGIVRRELVRRVAVGAEPLEAALIAAELGVIHGDHDAAACHLERVGELLRERSCPATDVASEPTAEWQRALRAASALALRGAQVPPSLRFSRAIVRPIARLPRFVAWMWRAAESKEVRLEDALRRLPPSLVAVRDALAAERIRRAAAVSRVADAFAAWSDGALVALGEPATPSEAALAGALGIRARVSSHPGDPARAAFDFGVALSPRITSRRTILLHACERALQIDGLSGEALRFRERCLRQLDGEALANTLLSILSTRPLSEGWVGTAITIAGRVQPKRVVACAFRRFDELTSGGQRLAPILEALVRDAALPPRFSECLRTLSARAPSTGFTRYWQDFSTAWARASGRAVHEAVAELLVAPSSAALLRVDGASAVARIARDVDDAIASNALLEPSAAPTLAWAAALRDPHKDAPWTPETWRARIASAREVGAPHVGTVVRLASALGLPKVARALLTGAAPTQELEGPAPIGGAMALRYLDKRRDVFQFLRVCDAAPCCFASDSPHYDRGIKTSAWVDRLFRDPLSFAYALDAPTGPAGFVFGGYGLLPRPALLLNGVYLKRQSTGVRADVLSTIERRHAAPLGIRTIGVAALHGGAGEMPAGYAAGSREGTRLRALEARGELETKIYDDICTSVNTPVTLRLHYRELA
ncbi:MAG: hypothetical protein U0414_12985 [Polyangiaceae bacterium]